jgi:branched-chain amino acid transport system ATP-binding protein
MLRPPHPAPGVTAVRERHAVLSVEGVDAYYGLSHVLQNVSLTVQPGEAVALLGRNGAGKTTTLKTIMGVVRARRGRITWNGMDITTLPPYRIVQLGIGYVPEERRIFPNLSVYENLKMARLTIDGGRRIDDYLARVFALFPPLQARLSNKGRTLSGGEQQMLTMARSLGTDPKLLLIDEPTEGLMPAFVETIGQTIGEIQRQGLAVLLVEQNTKLALAATRRVYLIEKGVIKHEGRSADLQSDPAVRLRYLGV